jgi:hypothetical protein
MISPFFTLTAFENIQTDFSSYANASADKHQVFLPTPLNYMLHWPAFQAVSGKCSEIIILSL